ncbi:hypothetical protein SLE2022_105130 [Rubroshorea leprosula]
MFEIPAFGSSSSSSSRSFKNPDFLRANSCRAEQVVASPFSKESKLPESIQFWRLIMVMKERDEELALFLEMRRREKEKNNQLFLLQNSDDLDTSLGSNGGGSSVSKVASSMPVRKTAADNFLNSENDKSDYDWLLTPPGTPLFPSLEKDAQKTLMSQNARPTVLKSRLENLPEEPAPRNKLAVKHPTLPTGQNTSSTSGRSTSNRRPSLSGGPKSSTRSSTPTSRPTLPTVTKPSRSYTPTSRTTLPSTKPAASARSSTPTRSTARSSTPPARLSIPTSKSTSRSATPTRRPAISSGAPSAAAPLGQSSLTKSGPTPLKNPVPSRGNSPTVRSRPWKPSEMPGFSLDTPPNLRTSLPERPASASRGRPGAPSVRSSSVEASSNGRPRRQSCSPSRSRTSSGSAHGNGSFIRPGHKVDSNCGDNEGPVVIGTKMVERVVNMRKLAPPKHDYDLSNHKNPTGKLSSSLDSSGFGRTLSKKSLDMALRHMDIRRSISGNQRPLMTNVPASSIYSVRSGSSKSRSNSVSDSPLATSSISSEPSVNNNSISLDGCEMEGHGFSSERGNSSPARQHAS